MPRPATLAFYAAVVLLPALFVLRVLARPDIAAPAPAWLTIVTWFSIALAAGIFALGVIGYRQTRAGSTSGFLRSGLAMAVAFIFVLVSVPEVLAHSAITLIE